MTVFLDENGVRHCRYTGRLVFVVLITILLEHLSPLVSTFAFWEICREFNPMKEVILLGLRSWTSRTFTHQSSRDLRLRGDAGDGISDVAVRLDKLMTNPADRLVTTYVARAPRLDVDGRCM